MNTQATSTNAIDWKHVSGVTLRAAWWLLKMAFKVLVILCTAIITVVGIIFLSGSDEDEDEGKNKKHWSDNDSNFDGSFPSYDLRGRSDATKNNL